MQLNMKILRTPDERFEGITDFPYEPRYTNIKTKDGSELRIHHIDEGPKDGPILLAMHGQPVWCYLYSRMIPFLKFSRKLLKKKLCKNLMLSL